MNSNEKHQTPGDLLVNIQSFNSELESTNLGLHRNVIATVSDNICLWQSNGNNQTPPNPWDQAHQEYARHGNITFAEPNLEHTVFQDTEVENKEEVSELEGSSAEDSISFNQDWPPFIHDAGSKIWHLKSSHSQLEDAIEHVTSSTNQIIRVAHIDTGYDPTHITFPKENIRFDLQRNYADTGKKEDARDPLDKKIPSNQGHGTGTLGILAGKAINQHGHIGPIGLTKNIEIVPIRIANTVALVKSDAFVRAMQHIVLLYDDPTTRIHIVTMSMGGVASHTWKELINIAYSKGIFVVTAAGNNLGRKTPRTLIHPARFGRVVAACGVTHEFGPYRKESLASSAMQGNFGPRVHMKTAMAAFTPNIPWPKAGTIDETRLSGAGTSSATPQIAMAAALYYSKYFDDLEKLDKGWKKVEAIRYALFNSALKCQDVNKQKGKSFKEDDFELYFGNGILQARSMLDIIPDETVLLETEKDQIFLPFIRVFLGLEASANLEMLELELVQIIQTDSTLQRLLNDEELSFEELDLSKQQMFLEHVLKLDQVSNTIKREIKYILKNLDV